MPPPAWPKSFGNAPEPDERAPIPTLISVPGLDAFSDEELKAAGDALGRRHATVWELAESGLTHEAISTTTGRPVGEIELILALKRQIQSAVPTTSKDSRS